MITARVKQEEEADKNNSKRVITNVKERNMVKKRNKKGLTSTKDLTIMLPSKYMVK